MEEYMNDKWQELKQNLEYKNECETVLSTYRQLLSNTEQNIKRLFYELRTVVIEQEQHSICGFCNKIAHYRCFICANVAVPSDYCKNHTHIHKTGHPEHRAIFQSIKYPTDSKPTKEQELERLEKRISELKKEIEQE